MKLSSLDTAAQPHGIHTRFPILPAARRGTFSCSDTITCVLTQRTAQRIVDCKSLCQRVFVFGSIESDRREWRSRGGVASLAILKQNGARASLRDLSEWSHFSLPITPGPLPSAISNHFSPSPDEPRSRFIVERHLNYRVPLKATAQTGGSY